VKNPNNNGFPDTDLTATTAPVGACGEVGFFTDAYVICDRLVAP
jgi:hypothetical protein